MPNYEVIVPALLAHGVDALPQHAALTAGIPVKPMLAKPTKGISEVPPPSHEPSNRTLTLTQTRIPHPSSLNPEPRTPNPAPRTPHPSPSL